MGLGLVLSGLGVASPTIWPQPTQIVAQAATATTNYIVTAPGVLDLVDAQVQITATVPDGVPVSVAIGRFPDVVGWLYPMEYTEVLGFSTWETLDTIEMHPAGSEVAADASGLPDPVGSDMWVRQEVGTDGVVTMEWEMPVVNAASILPQVDWVALIAAPTLAAPDALGVTLTWPAPVSTPYVWPLVGAGLASLLAGAALLLTSGRRPAAVAAGSEIMEPWVPDLKPVELIDDEVTLFAPEPVPEPADELVGEPSVDELTPSAAGVAFAAPLGVGAAAAGLETGIGYDVDGSLFAESHSTYEPSDELPIHLTPELLPVPEPAVVVLPEPVVVPAEQVVVEPEPAVFVAPEPGIVELEPEPEFEPAPVPLVVEPEPEFEPAPVPLVVEPEPEPVVVAEPEPVVIEPTPEPTPEPEPVAVELPVAVESPVESVLAEAVPVTAAEPPPITGYRPTVSRAQLRRAREKAAETGDYSELEALTGAIQVVPEPPALTSEVPVRAASWRAMWGLPEPETDGNSQGSDGGQA